MSIKKHIFRYLLFLMLSFIPLYANIDARIEAIRNAPVEERYMLMNAFKKEVLHMQEAERIDAISKLRSITQSHHSERAIKELQKHTKPKYHHNRESVLKTKGRTDIEYEHENENEAEDHIEDAREAQIEDEAEEHIENETEDHIEDETEDHIENETEDHIENETEDHIEDEHDDD